MRLCCNELLGVLDGICTLARDFFRLIKWTEYKKGVMYISDVSALPK